MLLNTKIHEKYGITSLKDIDSNHPYYNWHRRKDYMMFLACNGYIDGSNTHRNRMIESIDLQRYICSFI